MRKTFTPDQKAAIAAEALAKQKTVAQIASVYQVHPTQIKLWEKKAREALPSIFTDKRKPENKGKDELIARLYQAVGQKDIELAWLKKKLGLGP
jgi:transposase